MHPVKAGQFVDSGLDGKGCSGPALVVPGIAMAVGYGEGDAGECGRCPAVDGKSVLAWPG
jgi:hypothetical protein